ncbi:Mth938-like domain-containing protein [Candidatus Kinetoplastidibacterium galati]|uniref:Mth938-like domain-containing protein n=1 Tax=Candidatus Kinetoplastidibacterium galati TCC219 TaxID=1208921 RepID=M1LYB7_9PROT|nr:Mth938-like domain-containing protein [Candidatus Kinetoplastibacterium galatii]AGF49071.1 conserved hypothetical protein of the DUF498/DUF598 family [Candidatus Kinetoplastibacterium galatii TCC219]
MKLHSEDYTSNNVINSYKEGSININGIAYTDNILFSNSGKILKWDIVNVLDIDCKILINMLESLRYQEILQKPVEFILIGAGSKYVARNDFIINSIPVLGIGIEIMKTSSAIYTYNAMLMQDRQVLTALIIRD